MSLISFGGAESTSITLLPEILLPASTEPASDPSAVAIFLSSLPLKVGGLASSIDDGAGELSFYYQHFRTTLHINTTK